MREWGKEGGSTPKKVKSGILSSGISSSQLSRLEAVRAFQKKPTSEQLETFFTVAKRYDRKFITSGSLNLYVRHNTRDIGEPVTSVVEGKKLGSVGLATVKCLDIADVEVKVPTLKVDMGPEGNLFELGTMDMIPQWERFIKEVIQTCPWEGIYIDQIGEPQIEEWCKDNGWWKIPVEPGQSDSYFTWINEEKKRVKRISSFF